MFHRQVFLLIFLVAVLSGCSMADISNSIKGSHYMATGEYQQAEKTFRKAVHDEPDNALATT